ncbi:MAG: hypothetical protein U0354_13500 [Candidatus Sericytochromatia bacterium]
MSQFNDDCKYICSKVDEAIVVGIIDLSSGMLLGLENKGDFNQVYFDKLSVTILELFRGKIIDKLEKNKKTNLVREVLINSNDIICFMKYIENTEKAIFMLTNKKINQGLGWSSFKIAIQEAKSLKN